MVHVRVCVFDLPKWVSDACKVNILNYVVPVNHDSVSSRPFFGKSGKRVSESITLSLKVSSAKLHFHLLLITRFRQFFTVKRKRAVQKIQLLRWDVEDITSFDQLPPSVVSRFMTSRSHRLHIRVSRKLGINPGTSPVHIWSGINYAVSRINSTAKFRWLRCIESWKRG